MATATRSKGPLETKHFPIDMAALISLGAALTSVQMTASRAAPPDGVYPLQTTTLAADVTIGAGTVQLHNNPQAGARLMIRPGQGDEETFKVISVSGVGDPFTATLDHLTWATHTSGDAVSYEPGVNARLFVDDTPTPAGTVVTPVIQKGAHGQRYHVSFLAVCNDGQTPEDEFLLVVDDISSVGSNIKQPSETRDIAMDFSPKLSEAHQSGATLSSATASIAANLNTATAQLGAQADPTDSTITLNAHPGVGAMLVLTPAGTGNTPSERVYVTGVTGAGPTYDVDVIPDLEFTHVNGADVTVYQGYTAAFLTGASSTIVGLEAVNRARRGQSGKGLKVVWLATTSQGEVLQSTGVISVEDVL